MRQHFDSPQPDRDRTRFLARIESPWLKGIISKLLAAGVSASLLMACVGPATPTASAATEQGRGTPTAAVATPYPTEAAAGPTPTPETVALVSTFSGLRNSPDSVSGVKIRLVKAGETLDGAIGVYVIPPAVADGVSTRWIGYDDGKGGVFWTTGNSAFVTTEFPFDQLPKISQLGKVLNDSAGPDVGGFVQQEATVTTTPTPTSIEPGQIVTDTIQPAEFTSTVLAQNIAKSGILTDSSRLTVTQNPDRSSFDVLNSSRTLIGTVALYENKWVLFDVNGISVGKIGSPENSNDVLAWAGESASQEKLQDIVENAIRLGMVGSAVDSSGKPISQAPLGLEAYGFSPETYGESTAKITVIASPVVYGMSKIIFRTSAGELIENDALTGILQGADGLYQEVEIVLGPSRSDLSYKHVIQVGSTDVLEASPIWNTPGVTIDVAKAQLDPTKKGGSYQLEVTIAYMPRTAAEQAKILATLRGQDGDALKKTTLASLANPAPGAVPILGPAAQLWIPASVGN